MAFDMTKYEVEFSCSDRDFWRFNLFMIVVGYDESGERVSFEDYTERIYELEYGVEVRLPPPGYDTNRRVGIISGKCAYVEIYIYAVANTLPASEVIRDTPSFPARLTVIAGQETVIDKEYTVNPWGGLTIVAEKADVRNIKRHGV